MRSAKKPLPGVRATLGEIIRPSEDPRIVYELWPRMDVIFDTRTGSASPVRTNSAGFRSGEYPVEKDRTTLRLAGIGDSLMFGWGVEQEAPYLAVLERLLNRPSSGARWEVMNSAVPGYNAAMAVETLKTKLLAYRPDVVVYGFCPNDAALPNFILPHQDPLSPRQSFLWQFVQGRLGLAPPPGDALQVAPRRDDDIGFEDDPKRVPERYRPITGWATFDRTMAELRDLGKTRGFRTFVVAFVPGSDDPRKERGLRRVADLGIPLLDVGRDQEVYIRAHGITEYAGSVLTLTATDLHPSPLSHEMAAEKLFRAMVDAGLVAPTVSAAGRPMASTPDGDGA